MRGLNIKCSDFEGSKVVHILNVCYSSVKYKSTSLNCSSKEMGFLNPNFPFFGDRGVLFSWDDAS